MRVRHDALQAAGEQVRSLAIELRPSMLDTHGLEATLHWLAEQHVRLGKRQAVARTAQSRRAGSPKNKGGNHDQSVAKVSHG